MLLAGCAAIKQGKADYEVGKSVLAEAETSGIAEANKLIEPVLPYLPEPIKPFAGTIAGALGFIITWRAGRKVRKGQPATAPFIGFAGQKIGAEFLLQQAVTVVVGVFHLIEAFGSKGKSLAGVILPVKDE